MSERFSRETLKVVVGQICQTIGWNAITGSAMNILLDVLHRYLQEIGRTTNTFSDLFGRNQPNLDDLGLAFNELGIEIRELREYVEYVDAVPCALAVPKYPIPKESNLNFLKPGSKEVMTRPVHVNEHLPPTVQLSIETGADAPSSPQTSPSFKRPGEPLDVSGKRPRINLEEEGRPLREISSVMMTTGGFISPAREGKLPEPKLVLPASDLRSVSPPPSVYPSVPPEVNREKKKMKMSHEPGREKEKKRDKHGDHGERRKHASVKDIAKLKAGKSSKSQNTQPISHHEKSLIEKLAMSPHLVITPLPSDTPPTTIKLPTEPDKQKLNIFKKISKVKEEDPSPILKDYDSLSFSHGSPSRPKTPDVVRSPEHKKKKKDKDREKKRRHKEDGRLRGVDVIPLERVERRPITPELLLPSPPPPPAPILSVPPPSSLPLFHPGLVPPAISNPLIPRFPLPMGPHFPNLPIPPARFMTPILRPDVPVDAPGSSTKSPLAILLDQEKKTHKKEKKEKKKKSKDKPKKDKKEKRHSDDKHKERKNKDKKEKKEKRKDKERGKEKEKVIEKEREKEKEREVVPEKPKDVVKVKEEVSVPKLTLKLAPPSPRPSSPRTEEPRKPVVKEEEPRKPKTQPTESRQAGPEVARISSLFSKHSKPEQKPLHVQTESLKTPKEAPLQKSPGTIIDKDGNKVCVVNHITIK